MSSFPIKKILTTVMAIFVTLSLCLGTLCGCDIVNDLFQDENGENINFQQDFQQDVDNMKVNFQEVENALKRITADNNFLNSIGLEDLTDETLASIQTPCEKCGGAHMRFTWNEMCQDCAIQQGVTGIYTIDDLIRYAPEPDELLDTVSRYSKAAYDKVREFLSGARDSVNGFINNFQPNDNENTSE